MMQQGAGVSLEQAEKRILQALTKEGGELTRSEIVLTTRMPYDLVIRALGELVREALVRVSHAEPSEEPSKLETIVLR